MDVQLTQDGRLAVFHDDFLTDFTCIHSLTLDQLQQRLPYVPELRQVINVAREFNNRSGDDLGGILIVELKAFSPHCDPADQFEQPLVSAAVSEVRKTNMTDKVIFDSFSPALLYLAAQAAPGIPRELDISGLQLLTPAQIEAITGLPVTIINKNISLGLTWAEIGQVFRLPGYASPQQFLATGMALGSVLWAVRWTSLDQPSNSSPEVARHLWRRPTHSACARSPIQRTRRPIGTFSPRWESTRSIALSRWACSCSRHFPNPDRDRARVVRTKRRHRKVKDSNVRKFAQMRNRSAPRPRDWPKPEVRCS